MNPRNGQLSRAMRNRAVEIQFCAEQSIGTTNKQEQLWNHNIYDAITAIFGCCSYEIITSENTPGTIRLLRQLQILLKKHSTQALLRCIALMESKFLDKTISTQKLFRSALRILISFMHEEDKSSTNDHELPLQEDLSLVPIEFPPLTRPSLAQRGKFNYFFLKLF